MVPKNPNQKTKPKHQKTERFPKHKIARSILRYLQFPLAMPSANLSSNLSPVYARDVFEDFKKKLSIIIDGGKAKIGIEATVIDLTSKPKR